MGRAVETNWGETIAVRGVHGCALVVIRRILTKLVSLRQLNEVFTNVFSNRFGWDGLWVARSSMMWDDLKSDLVRHALPLLSCYHNPNIL